ncbi:VCBS repeat-containing protein [Myxococcota bacterium]|nr:VCBS repeat-containing protein [Myxococcota bacterium]
MRTDPDGTRRGVPAVLLVAALATSGCSGFDPLGQRGDGADDDSAAADDDGTAGACVELVPAAAGPPDTGCTSTEPYEVFQPTMERLWQWTAPEAEPEHDQVLSIPLVIDLDDDDGDGQYGGAGDVPDVVFIGMAEQAWDAKGLLRAARGDDGTELWHDASLTELPSGFAPAAGELVPSSPGPEIVVKTVDNRIVCYSAAGAILWETPISETMKSGAISLHDMDHDGEPEVIYGRAILGGREGTLYGMGEYGAGKSHSSFPLSYAVDLDGDGELEVVVGNAAYRKDGSALWYNGLEDGTTAVGDFDLDGDPEVVVSSEGALRLQDHLGDLLWGPVDTLGEASNGAPPTVADFDGDGLPEIGIADVDYYQVYDTDGSLLWSHETAESSSGFTGSTVFDFNGDGTAEVVYADEEVMYVFEGPTGVILFEEPEHSSRTNIEYPVIVDVDGDGEADIVLTSNVVFEESGWDGVTALRGTNESGWWATRRIWNQHAYFVDNVLDDGTIPQHQPDPWEVHNSFRQARPATGWDGYPVPDLVPLVDAVCLDRCPERVAVAFRVWNRGADRVTSGLPVTLWDPSTGTVLATHYVGEPIEAGWTSSTQEISFDPATAPTASTDLVLRVDTFASGDGIHVECDEGNNEAAVAGVGCP